MEVKIISKRNNSLFKRTEVAASISGFSATPSRKETSELLCTELKCQSEVLVIKEIHQPFGSRSAKVIAFVYDSPEQAKKTERGYIFQRGMSKPKQAAAPSG